MNKSHVYRRTAEFLNGKGFYIVLILCIAAIGISGYVMVLNRNNGDNDSNSLPGITAQNNQSASNTEDDINVDNSKNSSGNTKNTETVSNDVQGIPADAKPTVTPTTKPTPVPTKAATTDKVFFMRPIAGAVLTVFSPDKLIYSKTLNDWRTHNGIDISAAVGSAVRAIADGTVKSVYVDDLMGTTVVISHNGGYQSVYSNLMAKTSVKVGDKVEVGAQIGGVGTTAASECIDPPHLHLEVYKDGVAIDPESVLPDPAN